MCIDSGTWLISDIVDVVVATRNSTSTPRMIETAFAAPES
jgi:hypothetical protein